MLDIFVHMFNTVCYHWVCSCALHAGIEWNLPPSTSTFCGLLHVICYRSLMESSFIQPQSIYKSVSFLLLGPMAVLKVLGCVNCWTLNNSNKSLNFVTLPYKPSTVSLGFWHISKRVSFQWIQLFHYLQSHPNDLGILVFLFTKLAWLQLSVSSLSYVHNNCVD